MTWYKQGAQGINFVGYAVIAFILVLFLAGIFTPLIPSTSPFFTTVNIIANGVTTTVSLIFQPLILIPLAVVIVVVAAVALRALSHSMGDAGSGSGSGYHR